MSSTQQTLPTAKPPAQRVEEGLSADRGEFKDPDLLEHLYVERGLSTKQIASEVFDGEISDEVVRIYVNRYGLNPTHRSEAPVSPATQKLIQLRELAAANGDESAPLEVMLERYAHLVD